MEHGDFCTSRGYFDCGFVFVWMDGGKIGGFGDKMRYVFRGLLIFFVRCFVFLTGIHGFWCIMGVDGREREHGGLDQR